jgi:hypothetical protein
MTETETTLAVAVPMALAAPAQVQAETDDRLIALWLHGKAAHTRRALAADIRDFLRAAARPGGMAPLRQAGRAGQHQHRAAAAKVPQAEPSG